MQGKNITKVATSDIQKNLGGGLAIDNKYGPKTTAAVQNFQTQNGLKADGIFGPLTQAAYDKKFPASNLITTSGSSRSDYAENTSKLDAALKGYNAPLTAVGSYTDPNISQPEKPDALNDTTSGSPSDPILQQLDALSTRANDSTKMMIENIKATKQRQAQKVDSQYNSYKGGLQLLGIQTNEAQVTPDLLMSHINEAETKHLSKLKELDDAETTALMDAENARADNDFKTLSTKMDYIKQIKNEKAQALKDYNDTISNAEEKATKQGDAVSKVIAPDIYETLQTLDPKDQEAFLVSIAKKFNIPLLSLSTSLVDAKEKYEAKKEKDDAAQAKKDEAANKLLSPTEAATLGVPYGTTEAQAAKLGITPARYKPTVPKSPSDAKTEKEEVAQGKNILKTGKLPDGTVIGNPQGGTEKDGFYDYGVYNTLFNAWQGTPKDFIAKFPVVGSINPLSYTKLPAALQSLLPKAAVKKPNNRSSNPEG